MAGTEQKDPWQITPDHASTRLITAGQRRRVVAYLDENKATTTIEPRPQANNQSLQHEHWSYEGELVMIHPPKSSDGIARTPRYRLDSSMDFDQKLVDARVLPAGRITRI